MARKVRQYRIIHETMLMDWLMRTYPPGSWRTNVRLGKLKPEFIEAAVTPEERRALYPWLASADAVVTLPGEVHIIECLVRPEWWKGYMLLLYKEYFLITEDDRAHWEKPIRLIIVTAIRNPLVERVYREHGIQIILFRPRYVEEYIWSLAPRKRRPYLAMTERP